MTQCNFHRFLICIRNDGYPVSLEKRKVYEALRDETAAQLHQVRIVDESGEDYLFPEDLFIPLELSRETEEAVASAG